MSVDETVIGADPVVVVNIARLCHEANRGVCEAQGDLSQVAWEDAPEWQHASCIDGVRFKLAHPDSGPAASHENWLALKRSEGWVYGPIKDVEAKTHPCMVPYEDLPFEQRVKDHVFGAIVRAMTVVTTSP